MRNPYSQRHSIIGAGMNALKRDQIGWDHDPYRRSLMLHMPTMTPRGKT